MGCAPPDSSTARTKRLKTEEVAASASPGEESLPLPEVAVEVVSM